ncbi:hypothetical protein D9M68_801970 [compost metagenome]
MIFSFTGIDEVVNKHLCQLLALKVIAVILVPVLPAVDVYGFLPCEISVAPKWLVDSVTRPFKLQKLGYIFLKRGCVSGKR